MHFEEMRARFARTSHPLLFDGFCRAAAGLYAANLNELSSAVTDNLLVRRLSSPRSRACASAAIDRRYAAGAPACVRDRLRMLLAAALDDHGAAGEAQRAIRLLCYLIDVAPSIGAGATFRAAALWSPAEAITDAMVIALDRVATLVDYRFRLANDLADLAGSADHDRDAKENAWTILVPKRSSGKARELALVRAAIACDELALWLDDELRGPLRELDAIWPSMAVMIRRGIQVGGGFYSLGHYAKLSRQDVGAILDGIWGADGVAPVPSPVARLSLPAHAAAVTRAA
jgi:hypothetical protein